MKDDNLDWLVEAIVMLSFGSFAIVTIYGIMMLVMAFWKAILFLTVIFILGAVILEHIRS